MPLNVDKISTGSLSINGTEINNNGLQTVAVDNVTIFGDGTITSPLSASSSPSFTYDIGQYVPSEGGIIYHRYLDVSNENYLVVSTVELGLTTWSNVTGSTSAQSSWDGLGNSNTIVSQLGHTSSAAKLCLDYSAGTISDWYLPAIDELYLLLQNRFNVNKTLQNIGETQLFYLNPIMGIVQGYWSSTQAGPIFMGQDSAMIINYFQIGITLGTKLNSYNVRPIRKFSLAI